MGDWSNNNDNGGGFYGGQNGGMNNGNFGGNQMGGMRGGQRGGFRGRGGPGFRGRGGRGGRGGGFGGTGATGAAGGPNAGKWHQRILLPARAIGCIIGRGGCKIKEIRAETGAMMIIKGDKEPERLVTAIGDTDCVSKVVEMVANNMITDFQDERSNRKPPRIMAKGQKQPADGEVQICLVLAEHDCGPIIGKKGARIITYVQETGCQVYVHNNYASGGEYLPGSNEKVVTITGTPDSCGKTMRRILDILRDEGQGSKGTRMWDMDQHGPVGFFGDDATWNGSGLPPGFCMMMPNMNAGQAHAHASGWGGPVPDGVDPLIQKLPEIAEADGTVKLKANLEQIGSIMGPKGIRIKELRRMSGAEIAIKEAEGDACMRIIHLYRGQISTEPSLRNATWLINICINAFCDSKASIVPFNNQCSLQDVVMSEAYGKPPGMEGSGDAQPSPVKQETTGGFGQMPSNLAGMQNNMMANMQSNMSSMGNMMGNNMMGNNMMGNSMMGNMGGNMMGNMGMMNGGGMGGMRGGFGSPRGGGPMRRGGFGNRNGF